jgi:branched-chain amino acid transport system permease protein
MLTAVAIGIPALRIRGLFLGVTTLAFAVPLSTFFLNPANFPKAIPTQVDRPLVLERFDLYDEKTLYWFCLTMLGIALVLLQGVRHSRTGRAMIAVRDNERAAAARGLSPTKIKLAAFAISGALAGLAGSMHVIALDGVRAGTYSPNISFEAFTMVVLGGATSVTGALLGAIALSYAKYKLSGGMQLFVTGAGVLFVLLVLPGGLARVVITARGFYFRLVARLHGITLAGPGGETGATEVDLAAAGGRLSAAGPDALAVPDDPGSPRATSRPAGA